MDDLAYLNSVLSAQDAPRSSTTARSIDQTTESLRTLLSSLQDQAEGEEEMDDAAVEALMRKLGEADTAADELGSRVDSLLNSLDTMLDGLNDAAPVSAAAAVDGVGAEAPVVSQSDVSKVADARIESSEKPVPG